MSDKNFYVLGDDNCKYEGMSKEQIIATIQEAISTGTIPELDAGVITKVKEQNKQRALSFWVGSQDEYNAIQKKADNCFYIINNSGNFAELKQKVDDDSKALQGLTNNFDNYKRETDEGIDQFEKTVNENLQTNQKIVEEIVKKSGAIVEEYHGDYSHYFKFSNGLEIEFGTIDIVNGGETIYSDCDIELSNYDNGGTYPRKSVKFPFYKAQNIVSLNVSFSEVAIGSTDKLFQVVNAYLQNGKYAFLVVELSGGDSNTVTKFNEKSFFITYSAFGFSSSN